MIRVKLFFSKFVIIKVLVRSYNIHLDICSENYYFIIILICVMGNCSIISILCEIKYENKFYK